VRSAFHMLSRNEPYHELVVFQSSIDG
jgi:hypothetical protein